MAKLTTTLIAATALVALAGCGPKKVKDLPPPPGPEGNAGGGGVRDPNAGLDGSNRARFQREVVSDTINFATDQYDIDPRARAILDSQAAWLARNPDVTVTLEGHADERGTREYNLALGDRRANSAKNYLAARGVNPARITTISYGKERPLALGSDEASWAQNRRAVTVALN
ncbi:MAG: peptidoglycan-associated lipoprotein Pal [Pseudomonadota bacterium]